MARNPVTRDDVAAAKQELEAAGQSVSVARVIAHLGRGSSSTVTPLLRAIREDDKAASPPAAPAEPVPEEVVAKLTEIARASALSMYRVIAEPVEALGRAKDAALAEDRKEMQADVDQALSELAQANTRIEEMDQQLSNRTAKLAETAERLAGAEEAARRAGDRHEQELQRERDERAATTEILQGQLQQLREDLQRERDATNMVRELADRLSGQLQDERTKLHAQLQENVTLTERLAGAATAHDKTRDQLTAMQDELQRERAERTAERTELRHDNEAARTAMADVQKRLESALSDAAELRGRLAAIAKPAVKKKTS